MMTGHSILWLAIAFLGLGLRAKAQVTYVGADDADAFLATGSTNNPAGADLTGLNFGAAGMLVVAPAASGEGEFQSILKFNLAAAVGLFNTNYGAGNWSVSALSLTLTGNYGIAGVQPNNAIFPVVQGGQFVIEWLANDDWLEGSGTPRLPTTDGVTYDSLPDLLSGTHAILATNLYTPPGNNVPVTYSLPLASNLLANVAAGGDVTFLLYAADNVVGYLFNSWNYGNGNQPLITVTATLNALAPKILSGTFANRRFSLNGLGNPNVVYQIQATTNLAKMSWQSIGTATADGGGNILFDDLNATNGQRFYRLSQ